jgi:hypothetical protein
VGGKGSENNDAGRQVPRNHMQESENQNAEREIPRNYIIRIL